jgi:hypothetical protein
MTRTLSHALNRQSVKQTDRQLHSPNLCPVLIVVRVPCPRKAVHYRCGWQEFGTPQFVQGRIDLSLGQITRCPHDENRQTLLLLLLRLLCCIQHHHSCITKTTTTLLGHGRSVGVGVYVETVGGSSYVGRCVSFSLVAVIVVAWLSTGSFSRRVLDPQVQSTHSVRVVSPVFSSSGRVGMFCVPPRACVSVGKNKIIRVILVIGRVLCRCCCCCCCCTTACCSRASER